MNTVASNPATNRQLETNVFASCNDQSLTVAQLQLFIKLGSMDDLDPTKNFAGIMSLGNALIEGDLHKIQAALSLYKGQSSLLFEHVAYLRRAFEHAGVSFLEPSVLKINGPLGQAKCTLVLSIVLESAGKIAFIASDSSTASYVHSFTRNKLGIMTLEPAKEDPALLLKQVSRLIRLPEKTPPPPASGV